MSLFSRARRATPDDSEIGANLEVLSAVGIFAGSPRSTLLRLALAMDRVAVPAQRYVVREGRIPTHFYVVGSGLLEVLSTGEGEHETVRVNSLQEGDHFGEIGLLEGMPATATVRSTTECVLYRIPAADFLAAIAASPSLSSTLLDRVAGGLARTHPSYAPAVGDRDRGGGQALLDDIARLADIVGPTLTPPGENELLKAVTSTAMNIFDAAACSLALLRSDRSLEFRAASGAGASEVIGLVVPPGEGIVGAVARTGKALVIEDVRLDQRFAASFAGATGYRPTSISARPLEAGGEVIGVIEVLDSALFSSDPQRSLVLLDLFARMAATAIDNGRAFSNLGTALLSAAADAARGHPLAEVLERTAEGRGTDRAPVLFAALVQRLTELEPAERDAEIAGLIGRLDDGGSPGS